MNTIKLKFSLLAWLVIFSACKSNSQQGSENIDKNQITWNADINAALAQAKASNKLLFVECYSPTCPICQSLEPFFKKTEVAEKYNTNFVNFKLDVGKAEVVKFLNDRKIYLPSFPQFLFFDSDGNLVHQGEVTANIKSFIDEADLASNTDKRAETYKKQFENGNRNIDFLIDYASYARIIKDTTANLAAANEIYTIYPKEKIGSEESWAITKKCVTDIDNGFAKYWFEHVAHAKEMETKEGHPDNEKNTLGGMIQASLYSARGRNYSSEKLQQIKSLMGKVGAAQYADGVTWEFESRALIKEGKPAQAMAIIERTAAKYSSSGQSLVYITSLLNDIFPNKDYIPKAKAWMAKAKTLIKEDKDLAEYYYILSGLQTKAGDKAAATLAATEAKSFATKAKLDMTKFNKI